MAKYTTSSYPLDGLRANISIIDMFNRGTIPNGENQLLALYLKVELKRTIDELGLTIKSKTVPDLLAELREYNANAATYIGTPNFYNNED